MPFRIYIHYIIYFFSFNFKLITVRDQVMSSRIKKFSPQNVTLKLVLDVLKVRIHTLLTVISAEDTVL